MLLLPLITTPLVADTQYTAETLLQTSLDKSTHHCDLSMGPTCAFSNACVSLGEEADGKSVVRVSLVSSSVKVPKILDATVLRGSSAFRVPVTIAQVQRFPAESRFQESGVLGALYGIRNFGHQLMDGE
jgi:hypothetical protein